MASGKGLYSKINFGRLHLTALVCAVLLCWNTPARGEVLILKSKAALEGRVIRKTDKYVYLSIGQSGSIRIAIRDIDFDATNRILFTKTNPHAATEQPIPVEVVEPVDDMEEAATADVTEDIPQPETTAGRHPLAALVDEMFEAIRTDSKDRMRILIPQIYANPEQGVKAVIEGIEREQDSHVRSIATVTILGSEAANKITALQTWITTLEKEEILSDILEVLEPATYPSLVNAVLKREPTLQTLDVRRAILNYLKNLYDQESIDYLCRYLGHPDLGQRAADSLQDKFYWMKTDFELGDEPTYDAIQTVCDLGSSEQVNPNRHAAILQLLLTLFEYRPFEKAEDSEMTEPRVDSRGRVDDSYVAPDKDAMTEHERVEQHIVEVIRNRYRQPFKTLVNKGLQSKSDTVKRLAMQLAADSQQEIYVHDFMVIAQTSTTTQPFRLQAIRCLGTFGQEKILPDLIELLRDKDRKIQSATHKALIQITGESKDAIYTEWLAWYHLNYE